MVLKISNERIRRAREGDWRLSQQRKATSNSCETSVFRSWTDLPGSHMSRDWGLCIGKSKGEKKGDCEVYDSFLSCWWAHLPCVSAHLSVPRPVWESFVRGSPQWRRGERARKAGWGHDLKGLGREGGEHWGAGEDRNSTFPLLSN